MKFCINCKHYQDTRGSKFARCTRDWHDPVTGKPIELGRGASYPRCADLRVTECVNPTAAAYCGPSGVGYEPRVKTCPVCNGSGVIAKPVITPCVFCDGVGYIDNGN